MQTPSPVPTMQMPVPPRPTLFGLRPPEPGAAARADLAACRAALRHGSKTFMAASLLLPRGVCEPASALYAFCRLADDAVDGQSGGGVGIEGGAGAGAGAGAVTGTDAKRNECGVAAAATPVAGNAVDRLRERVRLAYRGQPRDEPADRALAAVVAQHGIPAALFDALLEGFEWDLQGRRYDTLDALHDYAARVAGTVGAMMALLMGERSAEGLARACDLGVAMQLSNIARDVGEDARMGRLYLPRDWMRAAGLDPDAWLAQPVFNPALASVVRRLLDAADGLYRGVDTGVARLPLACRPGINAARFIYAEIGHAVARRGCDSVSARARVSGLRKMALLLRALTQVAPFGPFSGFARFAPFAPFASFTPPAGQHAVRPAPPLPATCFLVDAAAAAPLQRNATPPRRNLAQRVVWTFELFAQLEQRERGRAGAGPARATGRRAAG